VSIERLRSDLKFAASQGPDFAVMTTQEAVRAAFAEAHALYITNDGSIITGDRAAELYDDECIRHAKAREENARLRHENEELKNQLAQADENNESAQFEIGVLNRRVAEAEALSARLANELGVQKVFTIAARKDRDSFRTDNARLREEADLECRMRKTMETRHGEVVYAFTQLRADNARLREALATLGEIDTARAWKFAAGNAIDALEKRIVFARAALAEGEETA
jgi:hypothetical protein